ncbi:MAG: exonuclease domain-containing protein, partial [Atribacterota bacterium]|nr:exonuclease domain-containing protein [Atribacterota bacterium]
MKTSRSLIIKRYCANENIIRKNIAGIIIINNKIINTFESLINPYCNIPPFITQLTGIKNNMLVDAPGFHQIAKEFIQ